MQDWFYRSKFKKYIYQQYEQICLILSIFKSEGNVFSWISASNCPLRERKNLLKPYGPRSVLSLTEWTVFGLFENDNAI